MSLELSSVQVGIVGTGFMGPVHTEALRRLGVRVKGIAGATPEESKKAAKELLLEKAYDNYEQMLADPEIKVVHIGVPNHLHLEMTKQAVAAGKNVMCEKPLAMNSKESAELVELDKQTDLVCGVNYNLRYYPLCFDAKAKIAEGELGDLIYASGGFCQDWLLHKTDFNWRVLKDEGGPLRAIADIGTHWLDLVQHVTGQKVVEVCADLNTVYKTRLRPPAGSMQTFSKGSVDTSGWDEVPVDTEDMGCMLLRFANGMRGNIIISQVSAGRKNKLHFEIGGTKAALAWDAEKPNEMWMGFRNEANKTILKDPTINASSAAAVSSYPPGHAEGYPDTFKQCFKDFYGYLTGDRAEKPKFPTFADGHRELLLCEAILASHEQRKWVGID